MDYDQELKIDRHALDDALAEQPVVFARVAQDCALAISERDHAKEDLEVTRAEVSLDVRQRLEQEGTKSTEAVVAAQIELDRRYREAMKVLLETKAAADRLAAIKEAFAQRAFALKDLCGLYVAGYWGTDSVKSNKDCLEVENRGRTAARQRLDDRRKEKHRG